MASLVVGDKDCPFSTVVKKIQASPVLPTVLEDWRLLARALDTKPEIIQECQDDLNLDRKGRLHVIEDLLMHWRNKNGRNATLGKLVILIQNVCKWNELAESLRPMASGEPEIEIVENIENNLVVAENAKQIDSSDTGKMICDYGAYNHSRFYKGSSCEVFRGDHISTGRPVAVKILNKEGKYEDDYELELKNWMAVGGLKETVRHIVLLYEYRSVDRNECFFTMELAKADLKKRITQLKEEPGSHHDKVVGYLRDVADALQFLHNLSTAYIHRDVKPENIFIFDHTSDENGKTEIAKLGDFGITSKDGVQSPGCGTFHYMPPESYHSYSFMYFFENTWRLDVFSFGITCHEALSMGEHPFGDNTDEMIANIKELKEISETTTWPRPLNSCTTDYRCANHLFRWMMTKPTTYGEDTFPNRPNMEQVIRHPFFFTIEKKHKFFKEKSVPNSTVGYVQPNSSSPNWRKAVDEMLYNFYCSPEA